MFNSMHVSLLLSADCFSKLTFLKHLSGILSVSKSVDPGLARQCAGPDLGANCFQRLTLDKTC